MLCHYPPICIPLCSNCWEAHSPVLCQKHSSPLSDALGGGCFLPPPSLLIISYSLPFIERLDVCFYWKMVWILLRLEQAANTPVIRSKKEKRPPCSTWEVGVSELCSASLERGQISTCPADFEECMGRMYFDRPGCWAVPGQCLPRGSRR